MTLTTDVTKMKNTPKKNREFYVSWFAAIISGISVGYFFVNPSEGIFNINGNWGIILRWVICGMIVPFILHIIGYKFVHAKKLGTYYNYYIGYMGGYLGTCAVGFVLTYNSLQLTGWIVIILTNLLAYFLGAFAASQWIKRDD